MQSQWEVPCLPGVPRRELIYQPFQNEWTTPAHTPHTLTPHTLTPTPDQGLVEAEGEGDSGFQEAGGCVRLTCPPLVSPERAKEALLSASGKQLVPMVGPQRGPVSDELSNTYVDKARQASECASSHETCTHESSCNTRKMTISMEKNGPLKKKMVPFRKRHHSDRIEASIILVNILHFHSNYENKTLILQT